MSHRVGSFPLISNPHSLHTVQKVLVRGTVLEPIRNDSTSRLHDFAWSVRQSGSRSARTREESRDIHDGLVVLVQERHGLLEVLVRLRGVAHNDIRR